ncbi:MFS transporter [Celerinatantimonas sp. MCCC 1A17872]|uniref:MFS transporter n=1 Tax=Celerinatantimonas sp. MCCC 1A17872 TaxID=3177514 RepID=UPI0038CA531C
MNKLGKAGACSLMAVACLTIMVGCVIVPGLPNIAKNLNVPHLASWLVTLPSLGVVIFGAPVGNLMKRIGAYRVLLAGLALYGALGVIGMWLANPIVLFADRLILGGATAMVMASGTALISEFYHGDERLKMIALQGMSIELGGVIFLAIGGIFAQMHWQLPFILYLMAWVFLVGILLFVPKPANRSDAESIANADATPSVAQGKGRGNVAIVYFAACLTMVLFFTAVIMMPRFLAKLGLSEDQTGYFMAFISLVAVGAASQMPKIQRRFGSIMTLCIAFIGYAIAHFLYSTGVIELMILGAIFMGIGFGFSVPLVNHMVVECSTNAYRNQNLAMLSVAIFLGQFLSSFMSFIPGDGAMTFIVAGIAAIVISAFFLTQRLVKKSSNPSLSETNTGS